MGKGPCVEPRLFYYEEACQAWTYAPIRVDQILDVKGCMSTHGEEVVIRFKRLDMTDEEFNNLPED